MEQPRQRHVAVWIEPHLATGHGLDEEICPEYFFLDDEGRSHLRDQQGNTVREIGLKGLTLVSPDCIDRVIEAAEEQPEGNIFVTYAWTDEQGNITHIADGQGNPIAYDPADYAHAPSYEENPGKNIEWFVTFAVPMGLSNQ